MQKTHYQEKKLIIYVEYNTDFHIAQTKHLYKYLGIEEDLVIEQRTMKQKLTKLMNIKLTGKTMITTITTWAVLELTWRYGF